MPPRQSRIGQRVRSNEASKARSGKQKSAALKLARAEKRATQTPSKPHSPPLPVNLAALNAKSLAGISAGQPRFVADGVYRDWRFTCVDCGTRQVWTPGQQKWYFEVVKADIWMEPRRCRACRRKERDRRTASREASKAGLIRKRRAGSRDTS